MARKTDTVKRPSDGQAVAIRQLSWMQLRSSRALAQQESARGLVAMGGAEFMAAFRAINADKEKLAIRVGVTEDGTVVAEGQPFIDINPPKPDPLAGHDLLTVLMGGVQSYTREQVEDLDEADAEFLGRAILALSPTPRPEDEEKNAESPSTGA